MLEARLFKLSVTILLALYFCEGTWGLLQLAKPKVFLSSWGTLVFWHSYPIPFTEKLVPLYWIKAIWLIPFFFGAFFLSIYLLLFFRCPRLWGGAPRNFWVVQ